jgi:hypothetical protein
MVERETGEIADVADEIMAKGVSRRRWWRLRP